MIKMTDGFIPFSCFSSRVLDTVVVYRDARLKRDIVHLLSNSGPAVTSKMSAGEKGLDTFNYIIFQRVKCTICARRAGGDSRGQSPAFWRSKHPDHIRFCSDSETYSDGRRAQRRNFNLGDKKKVDVSSLEPPLKCLLFHYVDCSWRRKFSLDHECNVTKRKRNMRRGNWSFW